MSNPATYTVTLGSLAMTPTSAATFVEKGSLDLSDDLGQRSAGRFSVIDTTGGYHFANGLPVWIYDATNAVVWSGALVEDVEDRVGYSSGALRHRLMASDGSYFVAKRLVAKSYQAVLAGNIVGDLCSSYFNAEGVIGTRTTPVFTRASTAYLLDGTSVTSNNPRYETGGLAASKAVRVEEGTTNLLSANAASAETDTSGVSTQGAGVTLTRDTSQHWSGAASFKVVTTGTATSGLVTSNIAGTAGTVYAFSAWVMGTANDALKLRAADNTNAAGTDFNFTATTGVWTRITGTLTYGASSGTGLQLKLITQGSTSNTYYVDGIQIEAKGHATSWQLPGSARSDEKLQLPAYGNIRPDMGTIMVRAYIDSNARRQVSGSSPSLFGIDKGPVAGFGGALNLFHSDNSANWVVNIASSSFPSFADSSTPDGWHNFIMAWDSASLLVYVDGVLRCTQNNPPLYPLFAPSLYIGTDGGGFNAVGTVYQDVKTMVRKVTASEAAALAASSAFATMDETTSYLATLNQTLSCSTSIEDGPTIANSVLNYAHGDKCMDALAEASQFYWNVDRYRMLHFRARSSITGADIAGDTVLEDTNVQVSYNRPLYRNREFIPGTDLTSLQTEARKGNSNDRAWTFSYPLAQAPVALTVNGTAKTYGIKGIDTGKDFYWSGGDAVLAQDSGGTLLTSGDTISLQYYGTFPTVFTAEDTGEVATNQTNEGADTTGYYDEIDNVPGATTSSASAQYAAGKLARYSQAGQTVKFKTRATGYHSGQLCSTTVLSHAIVAAQMLVESVRAFDDGMDIYYEIKAVDGPTSSNWLDFFKAIENKIREVDSVNVGSGAPLVISQTTNESWTWSEAIVETVTTCLFPGVGVFPGTGQFPC